MEKFASSEEILDFAIAREEEAAAFYVELAAKVVDKPWLAEGLQHFAAEEKKHRDKLVAVKEGRLLLTPGAPVPDLRISDYTVAAQLSADMNFEDILTVAMHREKASFRLYSRLADITNDPGVRQTMLALAQEEAKHKLWLETQYDEEVLQEN